MPPDNTDSLQRSSLQKIMLHADSRKIKARVRLPVSKSIANRELIIQALSGGIKAAQNSEDLPDDVQVLMECLLSDSHELNARDAGTAARFLSAYLCVQEGREFILSASERMKQRPMGILVDVLIKLGADISYMEKTGFLPLAIRGKKMQGGLVQINAAVSSQFISALLLIAPVMEKGLHLELEGEISSAPYINMSLHLMKKHGIDYRYEGCDIFISPQKYVYGSETLEKDWSAASYWYELAALSEDCEIFMEGLKKESLQGDAEILNIMRELGVSSEFTENGVMLRKSGKLTHYFFYDFISCPDLAQTVAVTCAGLGIPARLTGLQSLRIKETDRIKAMSTELGKIGVTVIAGRDFLEIKPGNLKKALIQTYGDHRMAMAFAPLAVLLDGLEIVDRDVVSKSYPTFWLELQKAGISERS